MLLHSIPREISGPDLYWVGPDIPCLFPSNSHDRRSRSGHHSCARRNLQPEDLQEVYFCECFDCHFEVNYHYFVSEPGHYTCQSCVNEIHPRVGERNVNV